MDDGRRGFKGSKYQSKYQEDISLGIRSVGSVVPSLPVHKAIRTTRYDAKVASLHGSSPVYSAAAAAFL